MLVWDLLGVVDRIDFVSKWEGYWYVFDSQFVVLLLHRQSFLWFLTVVLSPVVVRLHTSCSLEGLFTFSLTYLWLYFTLTCEYIPWYIYYFSLTKIRALFVTCDFYLCLILLSSWCFTGKIVLYFSYIVHSLLHFSCMYQIH